MLHRNFPACRLLIAFIFIATFPAISVSNSSFPPDFHLLYEYEITVLDEQGISMPGVSVFTDDLKKVATATDENGKAVLKDLEYREVVNFTFVGYESLRIPFYEIRRRNGIVQMARASLKIAEVVVIGRRDDSPEQVPYTFDKISKAQIAFTESQTAADALWNNAGVFVQKTQMGGGSPVLRGFEANRVLLVVDGVRMNNAVYRSGHLQNSITVDNAMLEQTEVISGPGSLLYGSDAMGGVIHFRSKEPRLSLVPIAIGMPGSYVMDGNLYARYASANQEKSIHADLNYGKRKWASLTSLTFTDYNDLRTGDRRPAGYEDFGKRLYFVRRVGNNDQVIENTLQNADGTESPNYNVLIGTAYSQLDFLQKVKFQPSKDFYAILNFQQSASTDIPRYDFLTELTDPADPTSFRFAEWFYGPQRRLMSSLKMRFSKPTRLYDRATVIGSFQRVSDDRLQRRLHKSQRIFQSEDVLVGTLTADFDKNIGEPGRQRFMYGLDANYNYVYSESGRVKISDESLTKNPLSRFPVHNNVTTLATYANYQWNTADTSLTLNAGLRYTHARLFSKYSADSTFTWPPDFIDPGVVSTHGDLTWSLGATWRSKGGTEFKALASKAFRSPNIDDYSQLRPRNGFISIPNPDLLPERSYNGELAFAQVFGKQKNGRGIRVRLDLTAYYTLVQGLMTRRAFSLPDGTNLVKVDGEWYETRANVNAKKGIITGWSGEVQARLGSHWELRSNLNFVEGNSSFEVTNDLEQVVFDTLAPLDHIPPVHGFTSLTFQTKKLKLSATARYQGKKSLEKYGVSDVTLDGNGDPVLGRSGTEDNIEYSYSRLDENGKVVYDGTLAWTTWNFNSSWKISKSYSLNFAVENIADLHYRPFASGVSAAGRNFIVSFRVNLSK